MEKDNKTERELAAYPACRDMWDWKHKTRRLDAEALISLLREPGVTPLCKALTPTPLLHWAAWLNRPDACSLLLEKGEPVDQAVSIAPEYRKRLAKLSARKAVAAASFGISAGTHLLADNGAAPPDDLAVATDGCTALHIAARHGLDCLPVLLGAGADPHARNRVGGTPAGIALRQDSSFESWAMIKALRSLGLGTRAENLTVRPKGGRTRGGGRRQTAAGRGASENRGGRILAGRILAGRARGGGARKAGGRGAAQSRQATEGENRRKEGPAVTAGRPFPDLAIESV